VRREGRPAIRTGFSADPRIAVPIPSVSAILDDDDSSSPLSDPPSRIFSPALPEDIKPAIKRQLRKRIPKKKVEATQISAKEHEEALNQFIQDNSEESVSTASDSDGGNDWEDIDLSHNKLQASEERPNLEVTLERTKHSMHVK